MNEILSERWNPTYITNVDDFLALIATYFTQTDLRWLVPVFHARATSDFLRARTHPRGKQNKYGDGLLCSRKVISPTLRRNLCLPETVSPRKFLVISKYGRKVLPELNARVLGTSSHWCCDRSCLDRGPRKYKHVQGVSK